MSEQLGFDLESAPRLLAACACGSVRVVYVRLARRRHRCACLKCGRSPQSRPSVTEATEVWNRG